jgi:glutamine---fructose-6-phosphate transaminase (isomerizing)
MTTDKKHYEKTDTWNEILSEGVVWQTVLHELSSSPVVQRILETIGKRNEWLFVGCGTSFYLAEAAAFSWTLLTGQRARALPASEVFLYPGLSKADGADLQAVVISRSGRTSEAVRAANVLRQELQVPTLGITCAEKSALGAESDTTIVLRMADEKSTVMTRSFTSMLMALQFLAAQRAAKMRFLDELRGVAEQFAPRIRSLAEEIESFVGRHSFADYVFLGQGPFHGIARESALKVMEMSCSYSQFFHTLEFRHGPKAIVSPETCLTFFLSDTVQQAESEVLVEMKELGGVIIAICNRATESVRRASDLVVELNLDAHELALLAPYTVPCQLLGFFTGVGKGLNPDQPKNLTRVVILD